MWKYNGKLKEKNQCQTFEQQKRLKWTSKPSYMSHKLFENDLVVITNLHTLEYGY